MKPLIAGVHGYVGPRAMLILGNFDFLIAAEGTRFSFEHSREAAHGVGGEPFHMQIPMRMLKKMIMMGGWFDAEQAHDLHIVQRVVPVEEVEAETRRWAEELTKIPTEHFQAAKMSIHRMSELQGLVNMKSVQNMIVGHPPTPENQAWWAEAVEGGLKAALPSRDGDFDDDIDATLRDMPPLLGEWLIHPVPSSDPHCWPKGTTVGSLPSGDECFDTAGSDVVPLMCEEGRT